MKFDYSALGRRVRLLRKKAKLSQEELAERAGISPSFMGHIERGSRKLSVETLYALCLSLECSADELLGCEGGSPLSLSALLVQALAMAEEIEDKEEHRNLSFGELPAREIATQLPCSVQ